MNKIFKIIFGLIAILPGIVLADLPLGTNSQMQQPFTPYNQYNQSTPYGNQGYSPYMQGYGNGSGYYNPSSYQQNQSLQYQQYLANAQANQALQNAGSTSSDLLWMFTGSTGTLSEQMRSGFKSSGQTTFFGRFFSVLGNALYRRIGPGIDRTLGGLEARASMIGQPTGINGMYNQTGVQGYCAQCALQNSTNPNYQSQQALNPALFNGGTTPTSPTITNPGNSAGGISYTH